MNTIPLLLKRTVLSLLVATALGACSEAPTPEPVTPPPILQGNQLRFPAGHPQLALIGISTSTPGRAIAVDLPAKLVWNEERTQRIYPAFAGRISAIQADVGLIVKPGTVLAQLASPDFGMAQADTAKAQVDLQLAQKSLSRQKELFDAGIIARKDLEQAQADYARAEAESDRALARTKLYSAGTGINQQLAIKSTINGMVVERNLNPGQELRPDQSGPGIPALFVVSDPTSLWVQIDARDSEAATLRVGTNFELFITALPGQKFEGKVTATADFIDPTTRTIKVRGVIANPERRLKAEMLATARIQRQLGNGVIVPASAVILRGTKQFVFVQVQPGVFEPREVERSYEGAKEAVISRGLEVGEQVVSDNALLLGRQFRLASDEAKTPVLTSGAVPASTAAASTSMAPKATTP